MAKKLFILSMIISLMAIPNGTQAQELRLGFKLGANYANLFGDDDRYNDAVIEFHGGIVAEKELKRNFSMQAELLYSRQGTDNEGRFTLSYISLPILVRMNFVRNKLGFYLGPQVSYLLSADYNLEGFDGDAGDFYKSIDVAVVLGSEFNISKEINVGARYLFSIPSIGAEYDVEVPLPNGTVSTQTFEAAKVRNSVIQIYFGYRFD